jgi:hypothetical protein
MGRLRGLSADVRWDGYVGCLLTSDTCRITSIAVNIIRILWYYRNFEDTAHDAVCIRLLCACCMYVCMYVLIVTLNIPVGSDPTENSIHFLSVTVCSFDVTGTQKYSVVEVHLR